MAATNRRIPDVGDITLGLKAFIEKNIESDADVGVTPYGTQLDKCCNGKTLIAIEETGLVPMAGHDLVTLAGNGGNGQTPTATRATINIRIAQCRKKSKNGEFIWDTAGEVNRIKQRQRLMSVLVKAMQSGKLPADNEDTFLLFDGGLVQAAPEPVTNNACSIYVFTLFVRGCWYVIEDDTEI